MFSPLNIIIRASRIKRGLFIAIHLLAMLSVLSTSLAYYWQFLLCLVVLVSAIYELQAKEELVTLYWDIGNREVKVAIGAAALQHCVGITDLYLVAGILYLNINKQTGSSIKILIFPDSVDKQSYRRLRAVARWASIAPKKE